MDVSCGPSSENKQTVTILVTGANSGLGFGICCRLIDEFLYTRPQSQNLHLLFSTRDGKKSEDTLVRLHRHLQKTLKDANKRTPGVALLLEPRITLEGLQVDLAKLPTVKALASQLLKRRQHIDAVIWNAGTPGWSGLSWLRAIWSICTDIVQATTYPDFMIRRVGLLAKRQMSDGYGSVHTFEEPRLGEVFLTNVFGHYMLTHWLAPLMDRESRVVWISSISATPDSFSVDDVQGIAAGAAYEGSKRLTDILVLTSTLPSTRPYLRSFLPPSRDQDQQPQMYTTHPGVVSTSISGLPLILTFLMNLSFYLVRLFGSPWHPGTAYKGAVSAVFAALAPSEQIEPNGKFGSATDVFGDERVARTEVEGWGFGDDVRFVPSGGLEVNRRGRRAVTMESREAFEEVGRQVWRKMEGLRAEWESRLGKMEIDGTAMLKDA